MAIHNLLTSSAMFCIVVAGWAKSNAQAGVIHNVTLTLSTPAPGANQLGVVGQVDTLSNVGDLNSSGSVVQLNGELSASLEFESDHSTGLITITGIAFHRPPDQSMQPLAQSPLEFDFWAPTGHLALETGMVDAYVQTRAGQGMTPVTGGRFQAAAQELIQSGGTVMLSTPEKPAMMQDLGIHPVYSQIDPLVPLGQLPLGSIEIILEQIDDQGAKYRVDVALPLDGQFLRFGDIGLPTTVSFVDGQLQGTGSFTLSVPEPTSALFAVLFACRFVLSRRRP